MVERMEIPKTTEWSFPSSSETHTLIYDGMLPPPPDVAHVPWCRGCRIERLTAERDRYRNALEGLLQLSSTAYAGGLRDFMNRVSVRCREALPKGKNE